MEAYLKKIILFIICTATMYASSIHYKQWKHDYTFGTYMREHNISDDFLDKISNEDLVFLSEIQAGTNYYELTSHEKLMQALIPIGEEMQIYIFRDLRNGQLRFDIIPIAHKEIDDEVLVNIDDKFEKTILSKLKNPTLLVSLAKMYKRYIKLSKLQKGDKLSLLYTQKSRLGKAISTPHIKAALVEHKGKKQYLFKDQNDLYHPETFKKLAYTQSKTIIASRSKYFVKPLNIMRITSKFTYKRWHPILKRYRPHLGLDIGAKTGTKIHATNDGKVVYAGWLGGYGKVTKIKHANGFLSLYAHQSKILVKRGQKIKSGQTIGYVGNTGRSTGSHLHFGLYKHGKPVNPSKYIGKRKIGVDKKITQKFTKYKQINIKNAIENKKVLENIQAGDEQGFQFEMYDKPYDTITGD